MKETIRGIDEMYARAADFTRTLHPNSTATVIGLTGDLGAGKTTFAQGVARALGITDPVTSPTFVIEKIYRLENQPFKQLIHIDAYRLQSAHELRVLGFEEIVRDPSNLILIEWPEKVKEALPNDTQTTNFRFVDEKTREIEV